MNFNTIMDLVKTFFESFAVNMKLYNIKEGLILAVVGLSIAALARRITRIVKRNNDIQNDDKTFMTIKLIGLILLFVGALIIVFQAGY